VTCAFCERIVHGDLVVENDLAVAFFDAYPVSAGHCLVVPRRHEPDFLALTEVEQAAIWALVALVRAQVEKGATPDGYSIGVNVGEAAGQTIGHAHLHVIPRRRGDVTDPRGGIRWVVPPNAAYWEGR
jgi:diadenosine tetraphosphate (Ap4A) HIT family hydrolase